jgi:hypothetical protein
VGTLPPARSWLAQDTERGLADDLVDERGIGRMDAACPYIAVEPLELVGLE